MTFTAYTQLLCIRVVKTYSVLELSKNHDNKEKPCHKFKPLSRELHENTKVNQIYPLRCIGHFPSS